tara:strand:- start:77 stop:715 length:639 start_codon:yes stop_codon:yes gene_type:complete
MGAGSAGSTGGGNGGVGPAGVTYRTVGTNRRTVKQYGTVESAKQTAKRNEFRVSGAREIDKIKVPGAINLLKGPLKAGSKITRDFFTNKVLTSKRGYKGLNKRQFESLSIAEQNKIYSGYISGRQSGKTDAYGNTLSGGGNDNTPRVEVKNIGGREVQVEAPTETEMSESQTESEEYDVRKTKRRGRRQTILTSQSGARGNLVLGKPSLLGA